MTHLVSQMGHVIIETADLDRSIAEARHLLGLRATAATEAEVALTSNARRAELTYIRSDRSAVHSIGLEGVDAHAVDLAAARAREAGLTLVRNHPLAPGADRGFALRGPSGHVYEFHTPVPRDQPARYATDGIRPKRLDHVNLTVPDPVAEYAMLHAVFGMELSDRSDGDEFLFIRAGDMFHHTIALVRGQSGLHHVSFEAEHVHDLVRVADQLARDGRAVLWGPGHHGANAQSYFTYHLDPIGCIIEYSFGMTRIDNETLYKPGTWPMQPESGEDWLNLWGAPPPGMFGTPGLPLADQQSVAAAA